TPHSPRALHPFPTRRSSDLPHVDEPRLPETRATGGKVFGETPHCFARSATRRGFGWWVAKPPTELRGIPLRSSTEVRTFSMRVRSEERRVGKECRSGGRPTH